MKTFWQKAFKWGAILGAVAIITPWLDTLTVEIRLAIGVFGLGMAIAYVEGSLKDRIEMLEARLDELVRRQGGWD